MEFVTSGSVKDGVLFLRNRKRMNEDLGRWDDCEVIVTVEKAHATRSLAQNAYYHAVVVARIAGAWHRDPKATHEILKAQFLPHDMAEKGINGTLLNGLVIGGSTAKLNKLQFIEYLETIVGWAAEKWDVYIPDPDPEWRAKAESEAA
jgi:L-serine deaminase